MGASAESITVSGTAPNPVQKMGIEYAIDIVNLSKRFVRRTAGGGGYTTLKSASLSLLRRMFDRTTEKNNNSTDNTITVALENLTMRIPKGASVGVIGRNGAGKSTFLKLLTGIYMPDSGAVKINGRLAALIELGAGFHPDFTGRENLVLGGVMYGLTRREIELRLPQIVHFAELEEVIDDPVRTYSSGMFMRLGFSLAVHVDPEILLIDEVLAVGDAAFTHKCKDHVSAMRKSGKTLVLVSHDLDAIERWCDEAIWLDKGVVKDRGEPRRVIDAYRAFVEKGEEVEIFALEEAAQQGATIDSIIAPSDTERWGSREIEITAARLFDKNGEPRRLFNPESTLVLEFDYLQHQAVPEVVFGIGISRSDGVVVHGSNTEIEQIKLPPLKERGTIRYEIDRLSLLDGQYRIDIAVHAPDGYPYDYQKGALHFAVRWPYKQAGVILPEHRWIIGED
jgi:ABC-type polysaccharide/polyol phosphate transport system ATPase subunit